MLAEHTGTGGAQREYIWIDDMPLAVVADIDTATPKLWYVHPDHLDRPVKMTNASKAVVWDAWYWPYGETRSITGSATLNLRFPGQYYLAESGLHYNWHRHYDPTLGRYLQPDLLRDVLAMRPVNLDGSTLVALGGQTGGAQLASVVASSGDYSGQIGSELPVGSISSKSSATCKCASACRSLSKLFPQLFYWRYSVRIVLHESS